MTRMGMVVNLERCMGCQTCVVSCKMQNNVPMGMLWNRVLTDGENIEDGVQGRYPYVKRTFLPIACQHCENAPCVKVCPVKATYQDDKGRVVIDYDRCIGCRYCMAACPYNARVFNWEKAVRIPDFNYGDAAVPQRKVGVVEKCTMCAERTDKDLEPMCVKCCPAEARIFGDLNDPKSQVSKLILERDGDQLLKEKGTNPNVYYLGLSGREK